CRVAALRFRQSLRRLDPLALVALGLLHLRGGRQHKARREEHGEREHVESGAHGRSLGSSSGAANMWRRLALTRLEAAVGLVDDVDAALAAHDAIVAVTAAQGLERIADFHFSLVAFGVMVGATGIEPVTPTMSR